MIAAFLASLLRVFTAGDAPDLSEREIEEWLGASRAPRAPSSLAQMVLD